LATVITLSGPLLVLVLALIVATTLGGSSPGVLPGVWMERLTTALLRPSRSGGSRHWNAVIRVLLPSLFAAAALLLGWVNAPDPVVLVLSVWLLAGTLSVPVPGAESMIDQLAGRFVGPLFYYALLGLPGAVFYRAVHGAAAPAWWLDRWLTFVPGRLAMAAVRLAGALRGQDARAMTRPGDGPLAPAQVAEAWRTVRLAAWIAAAIAALALYPRHAFLV
jgi:cobalamin biosynthesis protein CobD/CbiB